MIIHLKQRNITLKVLEMHQIRWLFDSIILFKLFKPIHLLIFQESQGKITTMKVGMKIWSYPYLL